MGLETKKPKLYTIQKVLSALFFGYFSYSTVREAKVHNFIIAFLFRALQLLILIYIIGWDIIKNKSYQATDPVSSTVTSKVKGLGYVKYMDRLRTLDPEILHRSQFNYRIFDTADYIVPPNEYNSTQSVCPEDYTKKPFHCSQDSDCDISSSLYNNWNGVPTGKCINSSIDRSTLVCEISGWCPVEIETERNILPNITNEYISMCRHHPIDDPYCPIFLVKDILEKAEPEEFERKMMLKKGGVIQIEINWECNLDLDFGKCMPKYTFERFDLKFRDLTGASGFNFRFADKYVVNGTMYRTLVKAYGLRFIIVVTGKAGRFDFIPLFLTIGAGIGLMVIPTLIADFVLLNLTKERKFYKQLKEYDYEEEENKEFNIKMSENRF